MLHGSVNAEAACVVGMCCMVVGMQKLHVILTCVVGMCYMYNTYMILENTCCCNGPRNSRWPRLFQQHILPCHGYRIGEVFLYYSNVYVNDALSQTFDKLRL